MPTPREILDDLGLLERPEVKAQLATPSVQSALARWKAELADFTQGESSQE